MNHLWRGNRPSILLTISSPRNRGDAMFMPLLAGMVGFLLFFLYDINSYTLRNRILGCSFFAGCVLILFSTAIQLYRAWLAEVFSSPADIPLLFLAFLSFICLIYCLFFALPFSETYVDAQDQRHVYDKGVYALCRHPGVLCFFALYLFLGLAALPHPLLYYGMILSFLNFLYVLFQDRITFPKTFCDYIEYKKHTPFIIPTPKSIRRAFHTIRREKRKEDLT